MPSLEQKHTQEDSNMYQTYEEEKAEAFFIRNHFLITQARPHAKRLHVISVMSVQTTNGF